MDSMFHCVLLSEKRRKIKLCHNQAYLFGVYSFMVVKEIYRFTRRIVDSSRSSLETVLSSRRMRTAALEKPLGVGCHLLGIRRGHDIGSDSIRGRRISGAASPLPLLTLLHHGVPGHLDGDYHVHTIQAAHRDKLAGQRNPVTTLHLLRSRGFHGRGRTARPGVPGEV